jgi:hypothetical protein
LATAFSDSNRGLFLIFVYNDGHSGLDYLH